MRKIWDIPGGIHPPENKDQSLQQPIAEIALPELLVLPLSQHMGTAAEPIVAVGERVLTGQEIAAAKGLVSAPVHASTSGEIVAIEERAIAHPSGMTDLCMVLRPDGRDQWIELHACEDYTRLDHQQLVEKVRAAGIVGLGGAGFPTAVKLNPRANYDIDTLIINGTECEPYITADDALMQAHADEVVAGTRLLAHMLDNPQQVLIGIEDNKPKAIAAMEAALAAGEGHPGSAVEVCTFPTKYPSGGEKQLIQILTGREVPSEQIPANIGVVCQNTGTAQAAWRAVRFGEPLIARITTVVGEALQTQRNIRARLGTPIAHVLAAHGFDAERCSRLVMGGPMMGFTLPTADVPIVKTTNCILAPSREELPPPPPAQACIRCGMCAEACPASLLPQQLFWYSQAQDYEKLQAYNLSDCIECGACAYVCPSNIPLVQYYRASKSTIRRMETEKEKSDRSRQRFEFHKQRIAREEAEKEAKRAARKKAAEQAKQKLAQARAAGGGERTGGSQADPVSAAMARAQTRQVAPQQQQAKLERAVSSAESRLQRARQRCDEAGDEQRDKLQARVKEAQARLDDARQKLAAHEGTGQAADKPDPVATAIARAQAKMALPPAERLRNNIASLQKRLATARQKLDQARQAGSDTVEALQTGVAKLETKIAATRAELDDLQAGAAPEHAQAPSADSEAAAAAIEKAKARAAARADMSPEEKLRSQIESLQDRLQKVRLRLEKAQADNDDNTDAFRTAAEKLEAKLTQTQQQLQQQPVTTDTSH